MSQHEIVADLHLHTSASDGELAPEDLVLAAAAAGLQAIAITDHDTLAGIDAAQRQGKSSGIEVIAGCEISTQFGAFEIHMLALFVDPHATALNALLERVQGERLRRAMAIAAKLRAHGLAIEDSEVLEAARGARAVGRPHVARALINKGYARSFQDAFVRYLGERGMAFVPKQALPFQEVINAVHAAGGLAIMAHPGSWPHDEIIAQLLSRGVDGLEALYRTHSPVNRRFYSGLAERYQRLISGGSDFHGPRLTPGVTPGDAGVDKRVLADLRRTAQQRAQYKSAGSSAR